MFETIGAEAQRQINETQDSFVRNRLQHFGIADVDKIENLNVPVIINQKPLTGNIRSTVATITDIYANLRLLFSRMGEPFVGYSHVFSFNHPGGMCPQCEGSGLEKIELAFLEDVEMICDVCHGSGYAPEILKYHYKGKNITEIMKMTVAEAIHFFDHEYLQQQFQLLMSLGLDYIAIGQRLNTFSGGERQRLKLSKEIDGTNHIIVLDEPSSGLHPSDTEKLIALLNDLVDQGNTVIVIEHNLEIMTQADWIIDIGPLAGDKGGELVFSGTVDDLIKNPGRSFTAFYLRKYLGLF